MKIWWGGTAPIWPSVSKVWLVTHFWAVLTLEWAVHFSQLVGACFSAEVEGLGARCFLRGMEAGNVLLSILIVMNQGRSLFLDIGTLLWGIQNRCLRVQQATSRGAPLVVASCWQVLGLRCFKPPRNVCSQILSSKVWCRNKWISWQCIFPGWYSPLGNFGEGITHLQFFRD